MSEVRPPSGDMSGGAFRDGERRPASPAIPQSIHRVSGAVWERTPVRPDQVRLTDGQILPDTEISRARSGASEFKTVIGRASGEARGVLAHGIAGDHMRAMFLGVKPVAELLPEETDALREAPLPERFAVADSHVYDRDLVRSVVTAHPEVFDDFPEEGDIDEYALAILDGTTQRVRQPRDHVRRGLLFGIPRDAAVAYGTHNGFARAFAEEANTEAGFIIGARREGVDTEFTPEQEDLRLRLAGVDSNGAMLERDEAFWAQRRRDLETVMVEQAEEVHDRRVGGEITLPLDEDRIGYLVGNRAVDARSFFFESGIPTAATAAFPERIEKLFELSGIDVEPLETAPDYETRAQAQTAFEDGLRSQEHKWHYTEGDYTGFVLLPTHTEDPVFPFEDSQGRTHELKGPELMLAFETQTLIENKTSDRPVIMLDLGGGIGKTWRKLAAFFEEAVAAGDVAFVVTNSKNHPEEYAKFESADASAGVVHNLTGMFSELKERSIDLGDGRSLPLAGNVDFMHEQRSLSLWSKVPERDIPHVVNGLLSAHATYVVGDEAVYEVSAAATQAEWDARLQGIQIAHVALQNRHGFSMSNTLDSGPYEGETVYYRVFKR